MKKLVAAAAAVVALAVPVAAPTVASAAYEEGEPNIERYVELHARVNPDAQCGTGGGSGAFGYFGPGYDLGHVYPGDSNGKPGANGYQTGLNNSAVCGNRP